MDSSDRQIQKWAAKKAGKPVKRVTINTDYYEGCPTCGDSSIDIEVWMSFEDGSFAEWNFTDFHNLLREVLAA